MRFLRVLRVSVHMSKGFRASPSLSRVQKVGKRSLEGGEGGKVEGGGKRGGEVAIQPSARGNRNRRRLHVHVTFPSCSSQRGVEIHGYQHHGELDKEAVR